MRSLETRLALVVVVPIILSCDISGTNPLLLVIGIGSVSLPRGVILTVTRARSHQDTMGLDSAASVVPAHLLMTVSETPVGAQLVTHLLLEVSTTLS